MSRYGLWLIGVSALLTVAANLLLRIGITKSGAFNASDGNALSIIMNLSMHPVFLLGVFFYGLAGLVWFRVVATEPLSLAYPILVGITFVMVSAGAVTLFNEPFGLIKLIGVLLILVGIIVASQEVSQ